MKLVNNGCCDCMLLEGFIVWNFGGATRTFYDPTAYPCVLPPGPYVYAPVSIPDWLSSRISAHGGVQQVELYANHCPDAGGGIAVATTTDWPNGVFLLSTTAGNALCAVDHLGTGLCETPGACDYEIPEIDPSALCWVLRGNDGKVIIQCSFCFFGEDMVIPPCPSSSSSSSSSSSAGDSSSSSSSSSSAGDPPLPPGSSSSSSSSSSAGDPPVEPPSSSSSSSSGCSCSVDGFAYSYDPYINGTDVVVDIYFEVTLTLSPGCEGDGEWTVTIKEQTLIVPGTAALIDSIIEVPVSPPEDVTVTVTWTGTAGALLGVSCQTTFTVPVLPN